MRLKKKELQKLHDRIATIANTHEHDDLKKECEVLQNHIYTLEDDDSSNPPGGPPNPPPGPGHG